MANSSQDLHDGPRRAPIRIWISGTFKPLAEATVSVFNSGLLRHRRRLNEVAQTLGPAPHGAAGPRGKVLPSRCCLS